MLCVLNNLNILHKLIEGMLINIVGERSDTRAPRFKKFFTRFVNIKLPAKSRTYLRQECSQ